jgi:hypothetical protein
MARALQDEGRTMFARPPTIKKLNKAAAARNSALATISRLATLVSSARTDMATLHFNFVIVNDRTKPEPDTFNEASRKEFSHDECAVFLLINSINSLGSQLCC